MKLERFWRAATRRGFVLGAGVSAVACTGAPAPAAPAGGESVMRLGPVEGGRIVLDARIAELREAPQLSELVARGGLEPVAQRIGQDPLVLAPLHETGRYGGVMRRAFIGPGDYQNPARFCTGPDALLYWDYAWRTIVPNIARSFELSDRDRVLTLKLRRGMRWSDGAPFTADDILFWYEDIYSDRRIVARATATMQTDRGDVRIEKIDDETVQYISPAPYSALIEILAGFTDLGGPSIAGRSGMGGFAPKHYLSQFHPKYSSEEEAVRRARDGGFSNWPVFLKSRNDWVLNADLPVVMPWRVVSELNRQEFILERNPYSIWVDTAGNQLPYLDGIHHVLCSGPDAVNFKAVAGQLDFQDRHLSITKLPYLLHNSERSGYNVHLDPYEGADIAVRINHGFRVDPVLGDLIRTTAFRRALSLGIDRNALLETLMLGAGTTGACVPIQGSRYYPGDDWAQRWATHDPAAANRMLDELGLSARDNGGYRLRPDGDGRIRLTCAVVISHFDYPAAAEMLRDQWRAIGIDLDVQVIEPNLLTQRGLSGELQLTILAVPGEDPFVFPDLTFPYTPNGIGASMGVEYAQWFQSRGEAGREPPGYIRDVMTLWRRGIAAGLEERNRIGRDVIRLCVDSVLNIGLVSGGLSQYGVHIANKRLGNVPRRILNTQILRAPANSLPQTFFFRPDETA